MTSIVSLVRPLPASGGQARLPGLRGESRPDLLRDEVLAEIFTATARSRPDHPAIICAGETLSYAEVDHRSDAIARGLVGAGIGPGDVVGLWMRRGADLLVAQIGITKSGAAWLPFDADAPLDRIATCLSDAEARGLLTDVAGSHRAAAAGLAVFTEAALAGAGDGPTVDVRERGLTPDHPAYLIYTSGSTGTPKGIVVTHRNICHFLRAGNALYGLTGEDVMFQSASVAFDLSMEEIWIPYLVGATLWVATPEILAETEALADVMARAGVTAIDTVPTLLSMFPKDVPSLRLVILGGEALPPSLVQRWARPGRRIFNTYGPTEATVVATASLVEPGRPVTIGRPIANYTCYVATEDLRLAAPGEQGELLIGGPGVAQGYLQRPQLTAEKFIANPFSPESGDPILYRSGDAVSLSEDGEILFHGRIDDQVKIRGFRVELGEIEVALDAMEGVAQAAVVLRRDDGIDRLVAFVVAEPGVKLERLGLRLALAERLPSYMVPSRFEVVDTLPRLSSGKVDRKALKALMLAEAEPAGAQEAALTPTEAVMLEAARQVFPGQAIPFEADFFTELGGHSLLAARFISVVRETPALAGITLQDVYAARTLRAMGRLLDERAPVGGHQPQDLSFEPPPLRRRLLCGLAQAATLPLILGLMTAQWLGVFVSYMLLSGEDTGFWASVATLMGVYVALNIATIAIAIATKWLVLGRTKPGRYPLWGAYYFRWWVVQRTLGLTHMKWLQGTPVMRAYLRALGARIGSDAMICEIDSGALDLMTIGDHASVGGKVIFANAEVVGNELVIGTVEIGPEACVGNSCVIGRDAVIGEGVELADLTAVSDGMVLPAWERWDGSPARKVGTVDAATLPQPPQASRARRVSQTIVYALVMLLLPPVSLLPIFPAFYLFDRLDETIGAIFDVSYLYTLPVLAWPTAMALIAVTVLLIAALRWVVLPSVKAGTYSVHSWFYVRKWIVAFATEVMLDTLSSLFATVYMRNWYRLMGAKIGKDAEISSNLSGRYDLIEIGEKCFIADEVTLGDEDIRRGWMTLAPVKTEARVFIGNDGVVPPGAVVPTGCLVGIKSKPPGNDEIQAGDTWFGSPPMKLPTRQKFDGVGANWTFEPSRGRRIGRAVFEAFNLSLPSMLFITCGTLAVELFMPAVVDKRWGLFALEFLGVGVGISVVMTLVVAAVKWMLMGRYKPTMKPMWSWWALRTEAVAVMYWGLAGKILLEHLRGTPMLPWALRLFGVKVGKGVYLDMTDLTEFDCVTIGDFVVMNGLSSLQTHLYEDRVMKVGRVEVARGVTIGAGSTVLYDTHVGDFARIGPLTLVMKGERLPANSAWCGAPAVPEAVRPVEHASEAKARVAA